MDVYHIFCDLKPGVRDLDFTDNVHAYLGALRSDGLIEAYRVTRRKLGLGIAGMPEFHIWIETTGMGQLEEAFQRVSSRADPVEGLHHAVNSLVENATFGLYRDFPDPQRRRGDERF